MKSKGLDQLLERTRKAIQETGSLDDQGRELLEELDRDIHALLGRSSEELHASTIQGRLREAIAHFEVSHPTLTALLSELSTILSNAGI
jgi:predicted component of type VI protein secretion system